MFTNAPGSGELPPPAYSEQECDRKTANAIELSLATSTQHQQEEEEWEEWDEAKFEAALRGQESSPRPTSNAVSNSSAVRALPCLPQPSSSTSHTQALPAPRVDEKKLLSKVPAQSVKPRPSWYDEAGLADSSTGSSSGSTYSRYTSSSNTSSSSSGFHPHHLVVHNFTPADEEEEDAPPPFSPNNSSAPAFGAIPVGDVITLSYNGRSSPNHISRLGPPPGTPPPSSRLVSPGTPEPAAPTPNPSSSVRPLLQVEPLRPRASSNIHIPSYNIGPPVRMGFDPNVAYSKNGGLVEKQKQIAPPSPSTPIDVLSLYNSSVSSVLESSSQRFNRPQVARNTPIPAASPRPMYASVTPPPLSNQNATQFPLQPSFTPNLSPYQYQSRWASSEQQFTHFG